MVSADPLELSWMTTFSAKNCLMNPTPV